MGTSLPQATHGIDWAALTAALRTDGENAAQALCDAVNSVLPATVVSLWAIRPEGARATCVAVARAEAAPAALAPVRAWVGTPGRRHGADAPWAEADRAPAFRGVAPDTPHQWHPAAGDAPATAAVVRLGEDRRQTWYLVAVAETEREATATTPVLELVAAVYSGGGSDDEGLDFHRIVETSPGIALVLRNGRVVYANAATLRSLGYSRVELCDPAFDPLTIVHPRDRRRMRGMTAGMGDRDLPEGPFEATLLARDGTAVDTLVSLSVQRTADETFVYMRAVDISERVRLETDLFAYTGQVGALQELLIAILESDLTRAEILERICKSICQIVGADIVSAFLFSPDRSVLTLETYYGPQADDARWFQDMEAALGPGPMQLPPSVWAGTGALAQSFAKQEAVVVEHALERAAQGGPSHQLVQAVGMGSFLWVPMLPGPDPLGVLYIGFHAATVDMSESQIQALSLFTAQAALALQKTALVEEERRRQQESAQLLGATAALREDLNLPGLFERIASGARRIVPAQYAAVALPDGEDALVVMHADGDAPEHVTEVSFSIASTPGGRAFRTGASLRLHEPTAEDIGEVAALLGITVRQVLIVPLISQQETIGVLVLVNKPEDSPFTERDQQLIETYAQQAAAQLDNATLLAQMTETKEYLEYLMDTASDIIYTHDLTGQLTSLNALGRQLAKRDFTDGLPNIGELVCPEDLPIAQEHIAAKLEGRPEKQPYELRILRGTGELVTLEIMSRLIERNGEPIGVVGIGRDITERRRLEDQVVRGEKLAAFSGLLSGVAHELNNPLTGVVGYAELLLGADDPRVRDQATRIYNEAQRCRTIVDALLALHPDSEWQAERVGCGPLVEQAVALVQYRYESENVHVTVTRDPELPAVRVPVDQLQRALLHVLENAHEAIRETGQPGTITVTTRGDGERVRIVIEDTGHGIPRDVGNRIFDPFYTTKAGPGRGLGLSMVNNVVTAAGGTVTIEGREPAGTRVTLELPGLVETAPPPDVRSAIPAAAPGEVRVLVVDDEEVIGDLLRDLLTMMEYTVDVAHDGAAALEMLATRRYAGIVSDIKMPGMNGMEMFREIETRFPDMVHRIVFASGDTMSADTRTFLEEAGRPYVRKPFNLSDLREIVGRVIQAAADA